MNETYLKLAMQNGGVVTMSNPPQGIVATMHWSQLGSTVAGQPSATVIDAMQSLNDALEDDAANEMD